MSTKPYRKEISWKPFLLSLSKHVAAFVMRNASLGILRLCPSTSSGRTDLTTKFQPYAGRVNTLLATVLILTLASCGVAPIVEPGTAVQVKDLSLSSSLRWNQFGDSRMRFWTIDGGMLNDLRVFADIKPGEHLFLAAKGRAERHGEGLLFRADMSELEVQELFVDALKRYDAVNVSASGLRPAKLGNRAGFRFELSFESGSGLSLGNRGGLKYKAMVLAETQGGTLSYLYFDAPAEFYFDRDKAAVEQIFATASAP